MSHYDYLQALIERLYREGKITKEEYEKLIQSVEELRKDGEN